jgi:hypothetical protein
VEGNTLEANPRRATGGPSKTSSDSAPGIKPLKGARDVRLERASREPQESRDRETGTDPAGGQSSERESRCEAGGATFRRVGSDCEAVYGLRPRDDGPGRGECPETHRDELKGDVTANLKRAIVDGSDPRGGHWCKLDRRSRQVRGTALWRSDSRGLAERGNPTEQMR